jgi:hypothetical protein
LVAFAVTIEFLNWQSSRPAVQQTHVEVSGPAPKQSGPIEVIDGDTVRANDAVYRLVDFDKAAMPGNLSQWKPQGVCPTTDRKSRPV